MSRSAVAVRELEAPVARVTVLEDRAQVRRLGRAEAPAGLHLLRVPGITPLCVDRTLRGELGGTARGRLLDVHVRREHTVRAARPAEDRELRDQIEALRAQYLERFAQLRLAEAQQKSLQRMVSDLLHAICIEAGRGGERKGAWAASLRRLDERARTVAEEVRSARLAADELAERIEQLGERHQLATQPTSFYTGCLEAAIELEQAGAVELTWEYLVPCALWRPAHRAELVGRELHWTLGAMVWQQTGEEWRDAQLALSTARPALGAELPLLDDDLLRLRVKTEAEAQTLEVEGRDDAIALLSPAAGGSGQAAVPGVDDGGEVRCFELPARVRVPSDGRAHLFELATFRAPATLEWICLPELVPAVMLRTRQANGSALPLLAGPVSLVREGGFVGRSLIPFVAPGESFHLGWGSEDELQVLRRVDRSEAEEVSFGRRTRARTWSRVFLSNTGATPRTIALGERIPVSELEEVKVRLVEKETTAGYRLDENGHLRWELTLPPGASRELCVAYDLDSSKKVFWR